MKILIIIWIAVLVLPISGQNIKVSRQLFLTAAGASENAIIRLQSQFAICHFGAMKSRHFIIGPTAVIKKDTSAAAMPVSFRLMQNYPNPFNESTLIEFWLPKPVYVQLDIYSVLVKHSAALVSGKMQTGKYKIQYNGMDDSGKPLCSGVYFCIMRSGNLQWTRKLTIIR